MRAAIYARASTERQERQQAIDSQLSALRVWAGAGGHELNGRHVFRDEGYSGARLDRPGLDALRDAVRDDEVEVLGILAPDPWPATTPIKPSCWRSSDGPATPSRSSVAPSPMTPATSSCCRFKGRSPSTSGRC